VIAKLKCFGRFHYAEVFVNGRRMGELMFSDELDISEVVTVGENELELVLWSGARNLLGPHHQAAVEEDLYVDTASFDLSGSWQNGRSERFAPRYSLMKFGIFG